MNRSPISLLAFALAAAGLLIQSQPVMAFPTAGGIRQARPGEEVLLHKGCGPWMILVATFHTTAADGKTVEGKTPDQAADELIRELRGLRFPAYKYVYEPEHEEIETVDSLGRSDHRKNLRRVRSVCVFGGNYDSINEYEPEGKLAQQSLKWVKDLYPKCLREGVVFQPSKTRPGPLSGAILTLNPLRSLEDLDHVVSDPLLLSLNAGENYSLFDNKGAFTLVIARFYGKSRTVGNETNTNVFTDFVNLLDKDRDLEDAAIAARELVTVLRGSYDQSKRFNNIDAYIWHGKYESFVSVGAFTSKDDPRIAAYMAKFGPTRQPQPDGSFLTQPSGFGATGFGKNGSETRMWIFEPQPYLTKVPRKR